MEGVTPGTTIISLILKDGTTEVCRDEVTVTAVGMQVSWETVGGAPISAPNPHPDAGIGVQHFPGATAPGGGWDDMV